MTDYSNHLLYGKNETTRIVAIEVHDDQAEIFRELEDGTIETTFVPNKYWMLSDRPHGKGWVKLQGNQHYGYGKQYNTKEEQQKAYSYLKNHDIFLVWNPVEALQIKDGYSFLKGMEIKDVSILSFDIETTGLKATKDSLLLISNTYRFKDKIVRKLFSFDEYESRGEMIEAWSEWVREMNPSIITGHNLCSFDVPHLVSVASLNHTSVAIGRDGSDLKLSKKESKFRVDGSRDLHYNKPIIYGRQVIDTMFLAYRYDIATKKYESYGLKQIIKQEGLEKEDRVFYDASQIRYNYMKPEELIKIKSYCESDSDDALALFDLMIPPFFYMTQMIPRSFQEVICSASGAQINSMMIRSYLQDKHGIPKASETVAFEGAISFGKPGIYKNSIRYDVASLYPSVIRQNRIYDKIKDPKANFLNLIETLTILRLEYKRLYKETGKKFYDHQQNSFKILINSFYGFLSATGLNYNSPVNAANVTRSGREVLIKGIEWATGESYDTWRLANIDEDRDLQDNSSE